MTKFESSNPGLESMWHYYLFSILFGVPVFQDTWNPKPESIASKCQLVKRYTNSTNRYLRSMRCLSLLEVTWNQGRHHSIPLNVSYSASFINLEAKEKDLWVQLTKGHCKRHITPKATAPILHNIFFKGPRVNSISLGSGVGFVGYYFWHPI